VKFTSSAATKARLASWCVALLFAVPASAEVIVGRVIGIADGDTLTILEAGTKQHKIRLAGIDAPERKQPFGTASQKHLSELAFGKEAKADCYKQDKYYRSVCTVTVGDQDIGLEQLNAGMAWWFVRYANEQPLVQRMAYEAAQRAASAKRVGLWQEDNALPPWEWRKTNR
jgi:endonuclease YncB( thermonuclease family)